MRIHQAGGCVTESELVGAVLECIECLTDDNTSMGGRFSGFALLMMTSTVCLFNVCFDIWFRRLMSVRTFTFHYMGVVSDV